MEQPIHSMKTLFDQLGLASGEQDIARFVSIHRPLPNDMSLPEAPCWDESQAAFLRKAIAEDADWAEVVDQLNARMR